MGVSGCGKTTVGRMLAEWLSLPFYDADDFHPAANREKLNQDIPLTDEDRWPWINLMASQMPEWLKADGAVLACSALKEIYRQAFCDAGTPVHFVYLQGSIEQIWQRLAGRKQPDHVLTRYANTIHAQFQDLEPPADATVVELANSREDVMAQVVRGLGQRGIIATQSM